MSSRKKAGWGRGGGRAKQTDFLNPGWEPKASPSPKPSGRGPWSSGASQATDPPGSQSPGLPAFPPPPWPFLPAAAGAPCVGRPSGPTVLGTRGTGDSRGRSRGAAGPATGHVRGFVTFLRLAPPGRPETHVAGASWCHHTGTRWGWAGVWQVKGAGTEEAPGKDGGVYACGLKTNHEAGPRVPLLANTQPCQATFSVLYVRTRSIQTSTQPYQVGPMSAPFRRRGRRPGREK